MEHIKHGPDVYKKRDPECVCFVLRPARKVDKPAPELYEDIVDVIASEDLVVANTISVPLSARVSVLDEAFKAPIFSESEVRRANQNDRSNPYEGFMDIDTPETQFSCHTQIKTAIDATSDKSQQAVLENNENPDFLEVNALITQQLCHIQPAPKDDSTSCLSAPDVQLMLEHHSCVGCRELAAVAPLTTPTKLLNLTRKEYRKPQKTRTKHHQASESYKKTPRGSKGSTQKQHCVQRGCSVR